jgi:hypothetical protein
MLKCKQQEPNHKFHLKQDPSPSEREAQIGNSGIDGNSREKGAKYANPRMDGF